MCPIFAPSLRGRAEVARRAHNPKVSGSNPLLATLAEWSSVLMAIFVFSAFQAAVGLVISVDIIPDWLVRSPLSLPRNPLLILRPQVYR